MPDDLEAIIHRAVKLVFNITGARIDVCTTVVRTLAMMDEVEGEETTEDGLVARAVGRIHSAHPIDHEHAWMKVRIMRLEKRLDVPASFEPAKPVDSITLLTRIEWWLDAKAEQYESETGFARAHDMAVELERELNDYIDARIAAALKVTP
mgnify:CR=1 FL=1